MVCRWSPLSWEERIGIFDAHRRRVALVDWGINAVISGSISDVCIHPKRLRRPLEVGSLPFEHGAGSARNATCRGTCRWCATKTRWRTGPALPLLAGGGQASMAHQTASTRHPHAGAAPGNTSYPAPPSGPRPSRSAVPSGRQGRCLPREAAPVRARPQQRGPRPHQAGRRGQAPTNPDGDTAPSRSPRNVQRRCRGHVTGRATQQNVVSATPLSSRWGLALPASAGAARPPPTGRGYRR